MGRTPHPLDAGAGAGPGRAACIPNSSNSAPRRHVARAIPRARGPGPTRWRSSGHRSRLPHPAKDGQCPPHPTARGQVPTCPPPDGRSPTPASRLPAPASRQDRTPPSRRGVGRHAAPFRGVRAAASRIGGVRDTGRRETSPPPWADQWGRSARNRAAQVGEVPAERPVNRDSEPGPGPGLSGRSGARR